MLTWAASCSVMISPWLGEVCWRRSSLFLIRSQAEGSVMVGSNLRGRKAELNLPASFNPHFACQPIMSDRSRSRDRSRSASPRRSSKHSSSHRSDDRLNLPAGVKEISTDDYLSVRPPALGP